jgi:hypothetical protein
MKHFCLTSIILTLLSINGLTQIERLQNESPENFAKRNAPPQSELVHDVIETTSWGNQKSVIAFYQLENGSVTQVDGYLFVPNSAEVHEKILIHNFEHNGGTPIIKAVFFANADKDFAKELVIICSWNVSHYDVNGTFYETFIFDNPQFETNPIKLNYLEKVSDKVSGGCDCTYRDGIKGTKNLTLPLKCEWD